MIKLYNTQTKQKEEFKPQYEGKVNIYCCGPTTYNYIHLGNARPLVVFDTIRRYFLWNNYQVNYVQNFTDIDDKIINRAKEENSNAQAIAKKYIAAYFEDAGALSVLKADIHPLVTEHIPDIIELIELIIAKGHAYAAGQDVYFDVRSLPEYGSLSGRDIEDLQSGARVMPGETKRDPLDFALWKGAKEGEPFWDSPWGKGRPGWHIECSAMSAKYLGEEFDIHGGGADLIFPHHENELAQSRAAYDKPFAHYWMHNGFITVNQEKMSKSLGNFFLLRDILAKYEGETVRFYLLSTHYRSPIDFADDKLDMAAKSLKRIRTSQQLLQAAMANGQPGAGQIVDVVAKAKADLSEAMNDDFNTALAISVVFSFCHDLNSYLNSGNQLFTEDLEAAQAFFADFNYIMGLEEGKKEQDSGLEEELLQLILNIRENVRAKKDWPTADLIRDGLKDLGIAVEDTPQGARWKRL